MVDNNTPFQADAESEAYERAEAALFQPNAHSDENPPSHDEDTMLLNMNDESVEQINLFIDNKPQTLLHSRDEGGSEGHQTDSQAILDESLKHLAEQDSDVFRVASEVASVRGGVTPMDSDRRDELTVDGHVLQLRPALVDNVPAQKQAGFSTNEPALGSSAQRAFESLEALKADRQTDLHLEQEPHVLIGRDSFAPIQDDDDQKDAHSFAMRSDSFAEQQFPKSSASSEIYGLTTVVNHETSGKDPSSGALAQRMPEYSSKADDANDLTSITAQQLTLGKVQHSPSQVPCFNTPAEASNKFVPSLDLHNQRQEWTQHNLQKVINEDQLLATEPADFAGLAADPMRNWRDLIVENPFQHANQRGVEQPPRESLMMAASAQSPADVYHDGEYEPFASRVVSLGPNNALFTNQGATSDNNGASLASLVELEQEKITKKRRKADNLESTSLAGAEASESDEDENHSCEDEELVISPQPGIKQGSTANAAKVDSFTLQQPQVLLDDPYQSRQNDLQIFATNEERNADLIAAASSSVGRKNYSSLEDGEVRDDSDDSAADDSAEACRGYTNGQASQQLQVLKMVPRASESEILDEDNFFYGGAGHGDLDFEGSPGDYLSDKHQNGFQDFRQDDIEEPIATSTLNPFKFSGRNLPTETEKYESSVYQTPELNPSLNDSLKHYPMHSGSSQQQNFALTKKLLDYESSALVNEDGPMSTIVKARPGGTKIIGSCEDSGSEENIQSSNDDDSDEAIPLVVDQVAIADSVELRDAHNPFREKDDNYRDVDSSSPCIQTPESTSTRGVGVSTNRLTFGGTSASNQSQPSSSIKKEFTMLASEDYPCEYDEEQALSRGMGHIEKQPSITAIEDDDDEAEPHRRTIQQTSGERRRRSSRPIGSSSAPLVTKMEHTFGENQITLEHKEIEVSLDQQKASNELIKTPQAAGQQQNLAWLKNKEDISLSTDSIFNLQDEEVKQLLDGDRSKAKGLKNQTTLDKGSSTPEVTQLLAYIEQVEQEWISLTSGSYANLLKKCDPGQPQQKEQSMSTSKALPTELSSRITHQITQITVFYQMNQEKEGFRLPTKRVYQVARLAKQIIVQDKLNIPRQTRSQFTLTVLDMLKADQDYVLLRKLEKQQAQNMAAGGSGFVQSADSAKQGAIALSPSDSSDFLSIASSLTQQNADLCDELTAQAKLLRSPDQMQQNQVLKVGKKSKSSRQQQSMVEAPSQRNSKGSKGKQAQPQGRTLPQGKAMTQSQSQTSIIGSGQRLLSRAASSKRSLGTANQQHQQLNKAKKSMQSQKQLGQRPYEKSQSMQMETEGQKKSKLKTAAVPSLDLASVNNSLKANNLAKQEVAESLRLNDKMLLDNLDLKNQLKQFRKGYKAGVSYIGTKQQSVSNSVRSGNGGLDSKRMSSHKDSIQMAAHQLTSIDQIAQEINSSLLRNDSDALLIEMHGGPMSVQNLSFGENQSSESKKSLGFGAVQSMDGRRQKMKTSRAPAYSFTTSNFNNSLHVIPKKAPVRARSKKKAMNQAKFEADQIMFDLIKGTAGSKKSGSNSQRVSDGLGAAKAEESKRSKTAIHTQQTSSVMPQSQSQRNLEKKHQRLAEQARGPPIKNAASSIIRGNSAAIPYRVSRVAQPTQHRQFQIISENRKGDEDDDDLDDTWI